VWGTARATGAEVLLRVEDHDRQRCRPEFEAALLEDLEWLGLEPDLGTPADYRRGASPYRQSDNDQRYAAAVARLIDRGQRVYACDCSRRDRAGEGGDVPDRETPYPGRCRDRGLEPGAGRGLRLVLGPGVETFTDPWRGPQTQEPARQCGDLLLRDRLGNWTYQFAVVADDLEHQVDLVVRGEDLLESTGRQIRLARLLGRGMAPTFCHHPLIRKPGGAKLSKASGDTSLKALREAGVTSQEVIGRALEAMGWVVGPRPTALSEALGEVSRNLDRFTRA
jgi:glutamyl/glutaminyl-tRNA synthetase